MSANESLDHFVADELSRRADALAQGWIDGIERTQRRHQAKTALVADLREHVPALVRGIVEYMREPGETAHANVIERLRLHADRRRAVGYDIHELLSDFEVLSRLVFRAFSETVGRFEGRVDVRKVAELAGRLRQALMEITSDAVGMYRDAELEQRRVLGRKLSDFARTMSHELKNPLGAAHSGVQMLQDADVVKTADDRDRFTGIVLRNLVRMQDLIQDIRSLVTADNTDGLERWAALDSLIARVVGELQPQAAARGVRLTIEGGVPEHPRVAEGTGFGLAIASELIKGAGGRIWFDSEEKRGTTFYVVMPDGEDRRTMERRGADPSSSRHRPRRERHAV